MSSLGLRLSRLVNRVRALLPGRPHRERRLAPKPHFRPSVEGLEDLVLPSSIPVYTTAAYDLQMLAGIDRWDDSQEVAGLTVAFSPNGQFAANIPNNVFSITAPIVGQWHLNGNEIDFSYDTTGWTGVSVTEWSFAASIQTHDGVAVMNYLSASGNNIAAWVNNQGFSSSVTNAFKATILLKQVSGPSLSTLFPGAPAGTNPGSGGGTVDNGGGGGTADGGTTGGNWGGGGTTDAGGFGGAAGPILGGGTNGRPEGAAASAGNAAVATVHEVPTGDVTNLFTANVVPATGRQARSLRKHRVTLRITNNSNSALSSVRLTLNGLRKGVKLFGASGKISSGSPFVTLAGLQAGETREVTLAFQNGGNAPVSFEPMFLA